MQAARQILLALICPMTQAAAQFYVSPSGSDAYAGSIDKPFLTLQHARDVVRAQTSSMTADITVDIRDGIYRVQTPVTFSGLRFEHTNWAQPDSEGFAGQTSRGLFKYPDTANWIAAPAGIDIEHNELWECPYLGCHFGWTSFANNSLTNNIFRYNNVHDVMHLLCDGAGIHVLCNDVNGIYIFENWFHDITRSPWAGVHKNGAIYLDNESANVVCEHNVITNVQDQAFVLNTSQTNSDINNGTQDQSVKDNAGPVAAFADMRQWAADEGPAATIASRSPGRRGFDAGVNHHDRFVITAANGRIGVSAAAGSAYTVSLFRADGSLLLVKHAVGSTWIGVARGSGGACVALVRISG